MAPTELIGPLQLSVWWYVVAAAILLVAFVNLMAPLLRRAAGSTVTQRPKIPIPVRSTYMSRITEVEKKLNSGEIDVRDSAKDLAKIVREFASDAWGVQAEHLTYRDAAVAGLPDLANSLSGLYEAEFAEDDADNLAPQIADARRLVTQWS